MVFDSRRSGHALRTAEGQAASPRTHPGGLDGAGHDEATRPV